MDHQERLVDLPPGFRFHPTDEEIINCYLKEKVMDSSFSATAIGEADLNKCEPWDLPKKAKMGEKEWYFFCQRDRKYPTGMRTNRATESGYWKATGKDKEIYKLGNKSCLVGMKKTLVFYTGRAPKGEKSNWVMHEFRLEGKFSYYNLPKSAKDEWVVCRVFHKNNIGMNEKNKKILIIDNDNNINNNNINNNIGQQQLLRINSLGVDDMLDCSNSLPPLTDFDIPTTTSSPNPLPFNYNYNNYNYRPIPSHFNNNIPLHQNTPNLLHNNYYSQQGLLGISSTNNNHQCKAEQFSISNTNHSMVSLSQDTGLSTDNNNHNAEISSVISKHDCFRSYQDHDFEGISWEDL